jgi:hypothetical protein
MSTGFRPATLEARLGLGYYLGTLFLASAVLLLAVAGLGKLAAVFYPATFAARVVAVKDPVFPFLDARVTAFGAAVLELVCAAFIWRHRRSHRAWLALAYVVCLLLLYRVGLLLVGLETGPGCRCLGATVQWVGLHPALEGRLSGWLLAWWALGVCIWACARVLRVRHVASAMGTVWGMMLACSSAATAQHLELRGGLTWVVYYENGQEDKEATQPPKTFTVWLSSNRWCVKSDIELAFGQGSNTFYAVFANKEVPASAGVFAGFYPAFSPPIVTVPWLAFCSGSYFREDPEWQHLPLPWRLALVDPDAHRCKAEVSFLDQISRLPRRVTFRTTEQRLKSVAQSRYLRVGKLPRNDEILRQQDYTRLYPTGMVCGRYQVTIATNLFGMTLPWEAELEVYAQRGVFGGRLSGQQVTSLPPSRILQPKPVRTETFVRVRSMLRLSNAMQRSGEVPLTLLPAHAGVADSRLQSRELGVDHVRYWVRGHDQWKLAPDAQLTNLFVAALKQARWERRMHFFLRASLYLAFAAVLFFPLGLMAWRIVKSSNQRKTQQKCPI